MALVCLEAQTDMLNTEEPNTVNRILGAGYGVVEAASV
jgi:hypothetical protein